MAKKSFFNERTKAQIKALKPRHAPNQRNLVQRTIEIDPSEEALIIHNQLIPGRFFINVKNASQAARKAYKHGDYLILGHANSVAQALDETRLPHEIRREDFDTALRNQREEEINIMGYSTRPIQGRDKRKRIFPLPWIFEGARLFTYAVQSTEGIPIKPYHEAERVRQEGAKIMASVPAREAKKSRYDIRGENIPIVDSPEKHAIWPGFNTTYAEGRIPEHSLWSFGYKFARDQEQSNAVVLYPHDFAAALGIARHFMINEDNTTPWDMNPFAKPSQKAAEFYRTLCSNVLVQDPSLKSKDNLRKLYIPEKAILLARLVGKLGHDETIFWQAGRDPVLSNYDWSIPGLKESA